MSIPNFDLEEWNITAKADSSPIFTYSGHASLNLDGLMEKVPQKEELIDENYQIGDISLECFRLVIIEYGTICKYLKHPLTNKLRSDGRTSSFKFISRSTKKDELMARTSSCK